MPISIIMHLLIINLGFYYFNESFTKNPFQLLYLNAFWLIIAFFVGIYRFKRYTKAPKILVQLFYQFSIFAFAYLAFFSLFNEKLNIGFQLKFLSLIFFGITVFRMLYFYSLRRYRLSGYNYRNVVVIGKNHGVNSLIDFFKTRQEFGFHYKGFFDHKTSNRKDYLGKIENCYQYVLENDIDEIFCSTASLTKEQIERFIEFGDNHLKVIKFVPDSNDLFSKMKLEYYSMVPILSIRKLPFDNILIKRLKRLFDILFSLFIILTILSWLTPILFILVKLESKGPLFFKQIREGLKGKPFYCYKFRSMGVNANADQIQATKGDLRVTKVGKYIRKTSIDELPQFFNVLKGDMSVVGPRPHMLSQSAIFKKIVGKYMVRHFVKPGVTGLAQVKGFRGEIEKDSDIINRVKFDIFYIENWSFFLDIKIIIKTFLNTLQGEDKAY